MFSSTTHLYDIIYSFKDYASEAATLLALIEEELPDAASILDVACGTGEHIRQLLRLRAFDITGIDIEPGFVEIARKKNPEARFICADMRDFELNARFDVVICLFSAIGYLTSIEDLQRTVTQFARHVAPGGLIIVEPWFTHEQWNPGTVHVVSTESGDTKVVRMGRSDVNGRVSTLDFHYLVGSSTQIQYLNERHEFGLFTTEEITACFVQAGLNVRFDPVGLTGRGLYQARPRV